MGIRLCFFSLADPNKSHGTGCGHWKLGHKGSVDEGRSWPSVKFTTRPNIPLPRSPQEAQAKLIKHTTSINLAQLGPLVYNKNLYPAVTTGSGSSHLHLSHPEQIIFHDNSSEVMVYGACDAGSCRCSPVLSAFPKWTRNATLALEWQAYDYCRNRTRELAQNTLQ